MIKKVLCACILLLSLAASAEKPITMVVAFAPGGSADTSARLVAKQLSNNLGVPVVVDNRAGAGGVIAHNYVSEAPADGTTLLFSSVGPLTAAHFKDVKPVATVVQFPMVLVVPTSLGVTDLKQFIELSKTRSVTYASTGVNSVAHKQGEVLSERTGVPMLHVPYKGGSAAILDVISGRVDGFFTGLTVAEPHIKSGKLVAIAVSSAKRSAFIPDVPTVAEQGFPGFDMPNAYVVAVSSKAPDKLVNSLNKEINKVLQDPEVVDSLHGYGFTPIPLKVKEVNKFIDSSVKTYSLK